MNWNSQDNKRYCGKIDRIYVSQTEYYEVDYFVDAYLRKRMAELSDSNRSIVIRSIDRFPSKAPVMRVELEAFLDREITVG